ASDGHLVAGCQPVVIAGDDDRGGVAGTTDQSEACGSGQDAHLPGGKPAAYQHLVATVPIQIACGQPSLSAAGHIHVGGAKMVVLVVGQAPDLVAAGAGDQVVGVAGVDAGGGQVDNSGGGVEER